MNPQDLSNQIDKLVIGANTDVFNNMVKDISKYFDLGTISIEKIINQNIININPEVLGFLKDYNFNLVKDINTDLANKLKSTIKRNILQGGNSRMISKEIKDIFNSTQARANSIARTETARAYNTGAHIAAKNSPVKLLKYYSPVMDNRTTPLCKRLGRKYNKDNPIPVDDYFIDDVTGGKWLFPPTHPNCFLGDTKIKTNKGYKKIKDIDINDKVLTHRNRYKEVTNLMQRETNEYLEIVVGTNKNKRMIQVTGEHPILTTNGWKLAKELNTEDWVLRW